VKATHVSKSGPPDTLPTDEPENPVPPREEAPVKAEVAGAGLTDTTVRSSRHPLPLPHLPGPEVASTVIAAESNTDPNPTGKRLTATTTDMTHGHTQPPHTHTNNTHQTPENPPPEHPTTLPQTRTITTEPAPAIQAQPTHTQHRHHPHPPDNTTNTKHNNNPHTPEPKQPTPTTESHP
jgi:hypothetical protein